MEEKGKISFTAAVLMCINIMVGAGILYAVAPMTASAGSISFLGWPLVGLLLFPLIWCIAQAAYLFPGEGGIYHYCSTINPFAGFFAQWAYLLGYIGTAASLATVLRTGFVQNLGIEWIAHYPIVFNLTLAILYTLINLLAIEKISKIQSLGTLLKVTPILTVIALIAFYFHPNLSFDLTQLSAIGMSVSTIIFAFWGFEACCSLGGLMKDGPQKVAPAILIGFFITMGLYFLLHIGALYIMGPEQLGVHGAIAFPQFLGLSAGWTAALQIGITGAILLSWANSVLGASLGNITNIHFLARKKLILGNELLSVVNRNQRPVYSAVIHGIILLAFITFITEVDVLFALTNLGVITAFLFTLAAVFLAHLKQKNYFQLGVTILAFGICGILIYYSFSKIPNLLHTLPLVLGMAAGLIMYKVQKARQAETQIS
jgi:amino acid transporter